MTVTTHLLDSRHFPRLAPGRIGDGAEAGVAKYACGIQIVERP
jgi:hypothetical protein